MKRAEFKLILSLTVLFSLVGAIVAQDQKSQSSTAAKTQPAPSKKTADEKQKAANTTPQGQSSAQPNTPAKANNQGAKPSAPPSVKLTDIVRVDDLHVRVVWQVTGVPSGSAESSNNLNGVAGSINLSAEFANGQTASSTGLIGNDARSFVFTLTPVTPNNNPGNVNNPPIQQINPKTGEPLAPAPAGGGGPGSKETRSLPKPNGGAPLGGGTAKLSKATAQLTFNTKPGNQNVVLTDQLTRNF